MYIFAIRHYILVFSNYQSESCIVLTLTQDHSLYCKCTEGVLIYEIFKLARPEFDYLDSLLATKGQIISKGIFGILGFFQKTNEQIRF